MTLTTLTPAGGQDAAAGDRPDSRTVTLARLAGLTARADRLSMEIAQVQADLTDLRARHLLPPVPAVDILRYDRLTINHTSREVLVDGQPVHLAAREYQLLVFLAARPRQVFDRAALLEYVWGTRFQDLATVTEHVRRLRLRLAITPLITTVRGSGYRWDALPTATASR